MRKKSVWVSYFHCFAGWERIFRNYYERLQDIKIKPTNTQYSYSDIEWFIFHFRFRIRFPVAYIRFPVALRYKYSIMLWEIEYQMKYVKYPMPFNIIGIMTKNINDFELKMLLCVFSWWKAIVCIFFSISQSLTLYSVVYIFVNDSFIKS